MKKLIVISCLAVFFASCEKVIEPGELPEQDTRMVINAVLDKDSVVTVYLSQSKSIISGKDYKTIDKQNVFVYENDVFFEQLSFIAKGKYIGTKKPSVGKTYKVIARASNLPDAEGSTLMPNLPVIKAVERIDTVNSAPFIYNGFTSKDISVGGNISYKVSLEDFPNTNDFYSISLAGTIVDSTGLNEISLGTIYISDNTAGQNSNLNTFSYNGIYGTDQENVSNGNRVFNFTGNIYGSGTELKRPLKLYLMMVVTQISEDYYKYMLTTSKQISTGASFFAEPTVIYSNCSNGMGIVGGRTSTVKLLDPIIIK